MCTDCPLGRAHNFTGMTSLTDCQKCNIGFYGASVALATTMLFTIGLGIQYIWHLDCEHTIFLSETSAGENELKQYKGKMFSGKRDQEN